MSHRNHFPPGKICRELQITLVIDLDYDNILDLLADRGQLNIHEKLES